MDAFTILLTLISLLFVICTISIIFGDNILFRFAESTVIGAMGGHLIVMGFNAIKDGLLIPLSKGNVYLIFPLLLGIAVFGRYTKWPWVSRYPIAIMLGTGIGLSVRATIDAQIISQITSTTSLPLTTSNLVLNISNLVLILGVIASLSYFFFTIPLKGPMKTINTIGRLFLMLVFGAGASTYIIGHYTGMGAIFLYILKSLGTLFSG